MNTMEKSQNPAAVRSRAMITQALWELLELRPYAQITVTDITEQAKLGRKTFYRNYKEKDEILGDYLEGICACFLTKFKSEPPKSYYDFAHIVFSFWEPYGGRIRFLYEKNLFSFFQSAFSMILPEVSSFFPCSPNQEERFEYYCNLYVSGGFFQILCSWLLSGAEETPAVMAGYFERLRNGED